MSDSPVLPVEPVVGLIERRQRIVAALENAGYEVMPAHELAASVALARQERPEVVGVAFRSKDVPFRFACFVDDRRVSLRFGLTVKARRRHCQEWNQTRMYTKAYVDGDGELAMDHDYVMVEPWHDPVFQESVRIFVLSCVAASLWFKERAQFDARDLLRWTTWVMAGFGVAVFVHRLVTGT